MFSTSQSFPGIPQIGNNVDRVSRRSQSINRASSIVSNERSLATTVCATIHTATTPLDRFYHSLHYRTLTGHWKLFSAKSFVGDKEASVFVFEKKQNVKAAPRIGRLNRLTLVDLLKYEVTQLSSLVHPRILHLLHGVEETKDMLGFAAERVLGSLETIVKDGLLKSIEIKLGVLQIIDGLSYLHNSAKILHGNLTPSAIYVTSSRLWKISGFAFSVFAIDSVSLIFLWSRDISHYCCFCC
ncbi:hypothetical protein AB6A40_000563 [Gnathostoma spinigerum]|uniref:Protein kinase domain-containing protein n=1 Tax=Gnathostoma spinigerum TaxID=75299 RepID=A0ABD6E6S7_9BILA